MSAAPHTEPRETGGTILAVVNNEGVVYDIDPETGEVVAVHPPEPEFVVDTADKADWVMGKMLALDSEAAAIDSSAIVAQARAILANAESMKKDLTRRRDALEWRFGPELAQFAKANLGKTKTWKGLYGSVSFRVTPSRLTIENESQAVEWARSYCPEALKVTEKVLVSLVPDQDVAPIGFAIVPAGESVKISTGVGK